MLIPRDLYLQKLIKLRHTDLIKVVTGIRRCGKSYLLFEIFSSWLLNNGVDKAHIIKIDLENLRNAELRDPILLIKYIDSRISDEKMHYVLIDEVQMIDNFEDALNSFLKIKNVDLYVTGSNAKFLSKDIKTIFRGRSFDVRVYPLSFKEFKYAYSDLSLRMALELYSEYGGLPQVVGLEDPSLKTQYLKDLYLHTYLRDIKERYDIKYPEELDNLLNFLASSIGSITNPTKLTHTMNSVSHSDISRPTVVKYLDQIENSFLVEKALRYDLKGKKYFDTQFKYYFTDLGLRNARLNFRQSEPSHLMENIIYNELKVRGYNVDVGVVRVTERNSEGLQQRKQLEIDFVCNQGSKRYYIQSAYRMETEEKKIQEENSISRINDSFKKIIIIGEESLIHRNENGITTMSIYDFLLNDNSLEL